MIVEFFRHGKGLSKHAIEYLLGKDLSREHAKLLDGNIEEIAELIDSSPYAKKYTSGCLSFYEDDLQDHLKQKLMEAFEKVLFPDLARDENFKILWIEHRDKDNAETGKKRLELNFLIPNTEVSTGKRLQPFYFVADLERVDLFKKYINHKLKLFDPDDPINRQSLKVAKHLPKNLKEFTKALDKEVALAISELDENGQPKVKDRASLLDWMQEIGLEVTRKTKKQISIKNPDRPEGRPIVLRGEFYEQNFRCTAASADFKRRASEEYRRDAEKRCEESLRRLRELMQKKAHYHRIRFRKEDLNSSTDDSRQYQLKTDTHRDRDRRSTQEPTKELTGENNALRSQFRGVGERVSNRSGNDEQKTQNAASEHYKRIADIHRINRSGSQTKRNQGRAMDNHSVFSFDELYFTYCAWRSNLLKLQKNQSNKRDESNRIRAEKTRSQSEYSTVSEESLCRDRSEVSEQPLRQQARRRNDNRQEVYYRQGGEVDELTNRIIEHHRRSAEAIRIATERASESITAYNNSINDYLRATELHQHTQTAQHVTDNNSRKAQEYQPTVVRTNYLSEFFRELSAKLTKSIGESFNRVNAELNTRERCSTDHKRSTTSPNEVGTRDSDLRASETNQTKIRLIDQFSRGCTEVNTAPVYKALEILDQRKQLQLKQKRDNSYDSPSPF